MTLICKPCARAADGEPDAQHCGAANQPTAHCTCQHRQPNPRTSQKEN